MAGLREGDAVWVGRRVTGRVVAVRACTREDPPGCLHGRLPALMDDGEIPRAAGVPFDPSTHQLMLCWYPAMIEAMVAWCADRGMRVPRPNEPGQVHLEWYW